MDNINQAPKDRYAPVPEETRRFLEDKYKRRSLAPEALIIRPGLRMLHIGSLVLAFGMKSRNAESKIKPMPVLMLDDYIPFRIRRS
ncbi:hypothetical protein BGW38_010910 [Lunasporangiospora selenospora]|uniref:Uncharacterized protein n=1 Tax=Lunasporangiospora selenospora TaxID=979761 RepID=A0A9P6G326_9FUNG|nr:hypothetical protein BGW38_010910 [Lunasporangiospora selenospora]